jgi:hypothetical protein
MGYLGVVLVKNIMFFFILLATLTDKNDVIMDWQCGVGTFCFPLHLYFEFSVVLP